MNIYQSLQKYISKHGVQTNVLYFSTYIFESRK